MKRVPTALQRPSGRIPKKRSFGSQIPFESNSRIVTDTQFFSSLAKKLAYNKMEDWYKVSREDIEHHGGKILRYYDNSPSTAVQKIFPDYDWVEWKFEHLPAGYWTHSENQRRFLDWLGKELKFERMEDWYSISQKQLLDSGGIGLLSHFSNSPFLLLKHVYPEYEWLPWNFQRVGSDYWKHKENHKYFLDWIARQLGVKDMNDWQNITLKQIMDHGGRGLLVQYNFSLVQALQSVYPEHNWTSWTPIQKLPNRILDGLSTKSWNTSHRELFDSIGKKLNIKEMKDWYKVSKEDIYGASASAEVILQYEFHDSLSNALEIVYPEYQWKPWLFKQNVPVGFWNNMNNVFHFFDWLRRELNMNSMEDWYKVTIQQLTDYGGRGILHHFNYSFFDAVKSVYPEYEWLPWRFKPPPRGHWKDFENHKKFFDWLFKELQLKEMDDWYNVSQPQVVEHGGGGLLYQYYNHSMWVALESIYPEHQWVPWKGKKVVSQYWKDPKNHRKYFDWLGKQLGIKKMDDWYHVTVDQIHKNGGAGLLYHYYNHSYWDALRTVYPEHEWLFWKQPNTPITFWNHQSNQKQFVEWLDRQT